MQEINQDTIQNFRKEYVNNPIFTVGRNALSQNPISDLVYVNEEEQKVQDHFSIDLDNLPVQPLPG